MRDIPQCLSWDEGVTTKICDDFLIHLGTGQPIRDMVKAASPETIENAVELANTLTNGLIRTQEKNKKKELAQNITKELRHEGS